MKLKMLQDLFGFVKGEVAGIEIEGIVCRLCAGVDDVARLAENAGHPGGGGVLLYLVKLLFDIIRGKRLGVIYE